MIYKTKIFQAKFKKAAITDKDLIVACEEMEQGLVDANLGEFLFKKRIAMPGQGKSGSYRTIVGALAGKRYIFLYMFSKSSKSNVNHKEKLALRELAQHYIRFNQTTIDNLLKGGELMKVESIDE